MKPLATAACLIFLTGQACSQTLLPGSKAPSLGNLEPLSRAVPKLASGKVTVVEFWATWCGPCIEAMPHLSDLADRYKGQVAFVSINVRDRPVIKGKPENRRDQVTRIKAWVSQHQSTMRYPVALDDERGTAYNGWLIASGSQGIPRVFVVDTTGAVAWIGHPAKLETALANVLSGKNDINANKNELKRESNQNEQLEMARSAFARSIAAGDADAFETVLKRGYNLPVSVLEFGLQRAAIMNPPFALGRLKHYSKDIDQLGKNDACHIAGMIVQYAKEEKTKAEALALSAKFAEESKEKYRIYAFWYHAQTLHRLGDIKGRDEWIKKVAALKDTLTKDRWESLQKSINREIGRS